MTKYATRITSCLFNCHINEKTSSFMPTTIGYSAQNKRNCVKRLTEINIYMKSRTEFYVITKACRLTTANPFHDAMHINFFTSWHKEWSLFRFHVHVPLLNVTVFYLLMWGSYKPPLKIATWRIRAFLFIWQLFPRLFDETKSTGKCPVADIDFWDFYCSIPLYRHKAKIPSSEITWNTSYNFCSSTINFTQFKMRHIVS